LTNLRQHATTEPEPGYCDDLRARIAIMQTELDDLEALADGKTLLAEFQGDVGRWQDATFPKSTAASKIEHLRREVIELKESHDPDEAADCFILLLGLAHVDGFDLMAAAQKKMEVNRARRWGTPDAHGVVEHLPDSLLVCPTRDNGDHCGDRDHQKPHEPTPSCADTATMCPQCKPINESIS